jgi:hypothetical protein
MECADPKVIPWVLSLAIAPLWRSGFTRKEESSLVFGFARFFSPKKTVNTARAGVVQKRSLSQVKSSSYSAHKQKIAPLWCLVRVVCAAGKIETPCWCKVVRAAFKREV